MEAAKSKVSREKLNNHNFKVLPEEDYCIDYEGLKYKDHVLTDFGRMFCHLDRIMAKGSKKQQKLAVELYDKYLAIFMNKDMHKVVPNDFVAAKQRADEHFYNLLPEEKYTTVTDTFGRSHKVLDIKKCTEQEYNGAIQEWENKFREFLNDDLGETWCWEDDRTGLFHANVEYYPKLISPINIPSWIFAADTFNEPNFHGLSDVEKVALAHAIWFTLHKYSTGYIECSGHVEQWCRCNPSDVHQAFQSLYHRQLLMEPLYSCPDLSRPLTRNWGWMADVIYIQQVLSNYRREIDK